MSKRTLSLIFSLFIIALVFVILALYQPSANNNVSTPTPTAPLNLPETQLKFGTLTISQIASSTSAKTEYSLPINISTGKNKITAVQLEMSYDPQVLTEVNLTAGQFFEDPLFLLNQVETKTGRISFALGVKPKKTGKQGNGIIAILTFKTLNSFQKQTQISFLPKTSVTSENIAQSSLKDAIPAQIVVGQLTSTQSANTPNN